MEFSQQAEARKPERASALSVFSLGVNPDASARVISVFCESFSGHKVQDSWFVPFLAGQGPSSRKGQKWTKWLIEKAPVPVNRERRRGRKTFAESRAEVVEVRARATRAEFE